MPPAPAEPEDVPVLPPKHEPKESHSKYTSYITAYHVHVYLFMFVWYQAWTCHTIIAVLKGQVLYSRHY